MSGSREAILVDIEGTTTPIAFVHETLFPFAAARLETSCARAAADPRIHEALSLLRDEYERDDADLPVFGEGAPYAAYLMQRDRKSTGLKALQGLIWEVGYRTGELRSSVFPDVPQALERWRQDGARLRVFSSGSVLAQKLLFAHTERGDLTVHFEGYHDTTTGPKRESEAYAKIAGAFAMLADRILYLSDVVAELDAAAGAGMRTGLLLRPGNDPQPAHDHETYNDFSEIV